MTDTVHPLPATGRTKEAPLHSPTRILSAFSVMSSTTVFAIFLSTITNKIISVGAGTEGMAWMGLYRNLGQLVTGVVSLGYATLVLQQVANAKKEERVHGIIHGTLLLLFLQSLACAFLAAFLGKPLAQWMFGADAPLTQVQNARIVVVMAFVNIALQLLLAILRGQARIKQLAMIQMVTSTATLALIYPLLHLGSPGLAINVGSGSLIGAIVAFVVIYRLNQPPLSITAIRGGWQLLRQTSVPSLIIIFQNWIVLGGMLTARAIVNKYYGLSALGNYSAALLIIETGILVLMSSVRSYFLPAFGRLEQKEEKEYLFATMTSVLLVLSVCGSVTLLFGGEILISLLFSAEFTSSIHLLAIFSLSLVGQVFCYCFNTFLLHKGKILHFVLVDSFWTILFVVGAFLCARQAFPISSIVWMYVLAQTIGGMLYAIVTLRLYGRGLLTRRNLSLSWGSLIWLLIGYNVLRLERLSFTLIYLSICALLGSYLFKKFPVMDWIRRR